MRRSAYLVLPFAVFLSFSAHAQNAAEKVAPTIPETQILPADLSSPFEFLAASTSADAFVIQAAALAEAKAASPQVKTVAAELAKAHAALTEAARAAGATDKVEIATPAPDGEQTGLLGKLEALDGAEFDTAYVESQLFAYQRTIAYYKGWSDEGNALATFAGQSLPDLLARYARLVELAGTVGIGDAAQQPAQL